MSSVTGHQEKPFGELNRRRSCSDSAIELECGPRRCPLPDWVSPRSAHDPALCDSDEHHQWIEPDGRRTYGSKVRRTRALTIGSNTYEVSKVSSEHVKDDPLDADGTEGKQGFHLALIAPYEQLPTPPRRSGIDGPKYPPSPLPTRKSNRQEPEALRVGCPPGLCTCPIEQDLEGDDDSGSDDDYPTLHLDSGHEMNHELYVPSGKWEDVRHKSIDGWETLMRIKVTPPLSVMLRQGLISGNPITYIGRLWNTNNVPCWRGFFSELALFASSRHLRPLQGLVVPQIINVYIEPGFVNVAMEPPHECFWIEASPDMPEILKRRCVEAFEKLHARGILHGDPDLRHILINADAKVTIIDFKASATSTPLENVGLEEVGLRKASPEEFRLEMRRVKFQLDYDGAREKEREKLTRKMEGKLRDEDAVDPPVDTDALNLQWLKGCERQPTRFVVPGQTKEQVQLAVDRFLKIVENMERQMGKKTPAAQGRKQISKIEDGPGVSEVPVAPPRPKLMEKLAPLSLLRSPSRTFLLPPHEIRCVGGLTPKNRSSGELLPLVAEEASLQPGLSTESKAEDKAATHSAKNGLVPLTPGFGGVSPIADVLRPATVLEPSGHDGDDTSLVVPPLDSPTGKWSESDYSSGSEGRKDTREGTAVQATWTTCQPSKQSPTVSTFPILRTFTDVARKAIQVFSRIAGQTPAQSTVEHSQRQKTVESSRRKRRLSDSSASESSEHEARLRRKRLRRATTWSDPPDSSPQPIPTPAPRTWSLVAMDQSRGTLKRKLESEETSRLVWNAEQELRKKRCKLSELSDLSDASGSETGVEGARDRIAQPRKRSAESNTGKPVPVDALAGTRGNIVPQPDRRAPPIISRDYAYISHKVPKAPYVPHPPTENRMAAERAKYIGLFNAKACLEAGLPYPMTENQQGKLVPDLARSPYMFSVETFEEKQERKRREKEMGVKGAGKVQRSFGSLKRKLGTRRVGTGGEFEEKLYGSWRDAGDLLKKRVRSKVRFSTENLGGGDKTPGGDGNAGVLHRMVRRIKETNGILKQPRPIKVYNYQTRWEDEDEDLLSPKTGPEAERWDRSGGFGILGVWMRETRTKTEEAFRDECALRIYESQRRIESVSAEWQEEEERMKVARRREAEGRLIGL